MPRTNQYINMQNLYGAPESMEIMDQFFHHLTSRHGLSSKTVLEGFSRGGLYAFNWAAHRPANVAGLYVDAPVCDFKSWPGGKGTGPGYRGDWQKLLKAYGFTETQALAYDKIRSITSPRSPKPAFRSSRSSARPTRWSPSRKTSIS